MLARFLNSNATTTIHGMHFPPMFRQLITVIIWVNLPQITDHVVGGVEIAAKVDKCVVQSRDTCKLTKEVPFRTEPCTPAGCPAHRIRFSFSLEPVHDMPVNSWELHCNVCFSHSPQVSWGREAVNE